MKKTLKLTTPQIDELVKSQNEINQLSKILEDTKTKQYSQLVMLTGVNEFSDVKIENGVLSYEVKETFKETVKKDIAKKNLKGKPGQYDK